MYPPDANISKLILNIIMDGLRLSDWPVTGTWKGNGGGERTNKQTIKQPCGHYNLKTHLAKIR